MVASLSGSLVTSVLRGTQIGPLLPVFELYRWQETLGVSQ